MCNQNYLRLEESGREELLLRSISGHAIYMLDPAGFVCTWNQGATNIKGYVAEEILGQHFSIFYTSEDRERGQPQKALKTAVDLGHYESSGWRIRKDGRRFWASVVIDPIYRQGELIGFAKITRDISDRRETREHLAQTNRKLEIALTHMCQGLALYDSLGKLILANKRLSEIFSIPSDAISDEMSISDVMSALGFSAHRSRQMTRRLASLRPSDHPDHSRQETATGHIISIATRSMPEGGWVATFEDITERQKAESKVAYLACHDTLTELPNRALFRQKLQEAVAQMKRGVPFALLLLDIKAFSSINDTLGEAAGDQVLRSFARRLQGQVREVDFLARLDGNEFAILQHQPDLPRDTEALAFRLMETMGAPHEIDGQVVSAPPSVGIAIGTSDGSTAHEILRNADLALCRAKQSAVSSYTFFNPELDKELQLRRNLANDLVGAAARGEFTLHYQAIRDAQTGEAHGYEALLRWNHPTRGLIPPSEFVPIAEETGHIVAIGEWVLRTVCDEAASWSSPLRIAVNLSPVQFQKGSLPNIVGEALAASGLEPHRLELEITESILLKDDIGNSATLDELRKLGVHISLDDFGIGYSSLGYLRSFHFDTLKIDRSFVQDLPQSDSAKAIVSAIIGLGKSFGITVVAEGVETVSQLQSLQRYGCKEIQGYLFGRPRPAKELFRGPGNRYLTETRASAELTSPGRVVSIDLRATKTRRMEHRRPSRPESLMPLLGGE
jgi:diguanylate cyclase (GGDEF)-like protein/PAS domain S-box-containing protein